MKLLFALCILAIPLVFVAALLAHSFGWTNLARRGGLALFSSILAALSIRELALAYQALSTGKINVSSRAGSIVSIAAEQSPIVFWIVLLLLFACAVVFVAISFKGFKHLFTGRSGAA